MDYLNKDLLREMSREGLEAYQASLKKDLADRAMFLLQVEEVLEEE